MSINEIPTDPAAPTTRREVAVARALAAGRAGAEGRVSC